MTTDIQPGQTFRSCDPRDQIRIRITSINDANTHALVVDAATGKRPRRIKLTSLHLSGRNTNGTPRRTGYRLERVDPTT